MAGLRERKKAQTRQALSWAAVKLSVQRGFENVLVEDIAAEAGVSPRTFNNYFASKAEAVAARHVDRIAMITSELRERPKDEPLWTAITAAVLDQDGIDAEPPAGWVEGVRVMVETPALQGEIAKAYTVAGRALAEVIAERTGTDPERDLYPKLVAQMVGVAYDVATTHWMNATDRPQRLAELLRDALEQVASGLPDPKS